MSDIPFGRLTDLPLTTAWSHEARDFTPWLAANLDRLSEAVGMPLELVGTEVAVDSFSADILARNPVDDGVVLIENQFTQTDHTHLGQIMTYLAGLEAQTVIWIAPRFREPHLSAIRWLNRHTEEGFSFFAVRARVVRIGDSPFAPVFEVVEQPNDWDRRVHVRKTAVTKPGSDERNERRQAFWQAYLDRVPGAAEWGLRPLKLANAWYPITCLDVEAYLSLWIGKDRCGVFLRGARGSDPDALVELLEPHAQELERRLGTVLQNGDPRFALATSERWSYNDPSGWPDAIDWMERTRQAYESALAEVAAAPPP